MNDKIPDWLADAISRHPEWAVYNDPVDIKKCRDALQRFIDREARLCVPAQPDDDDMLISRALDELEQARKVK